ncbi:MAG: V-type ATP synthase subunit E [Bacteroidetes bacterium]|nr:V-type ATP synthase subunit E [Bacteroidota bacterium]
MENKLQELTQKIYSEGIQKAEQEAQVIREKARTEADAIIEQARKEAADIIRQVENHAGEIRKNVNAELKLSASQIISAIKQKITSLITLRIIGEPVKEVYKDKEFIRKIIIMLIQNWSASSGSEGVQVHIPAKDDAELGLFLRSQLQQLLSGGIDISFDENMSSGFKIGPKDGSYIISFTDEDFAGFLKTYLRPRTNQLLYGGD